MLAFNKLRFSGQQCEHAGKIVDKIEFLREGWDNDPRGGRRHWLHLKVPSSAGGEYMVALIGNGKVESAVCKSKDGAYLGCEASHDGVPCYHIKASLLWLESRPATKAAREGKTLLGALAQTIQAGVAQLA